MPRLRDKALTGEVERSGLTGRGGAAFPMGKKLRAVRERAGLRGAAVIANGVESEPASAKDAALLARAPHLVLDGIALAAEATTARAAYLCVRRQAQADALGAAIAERAGYDPVPVQLVMVPEQYVSSAETSLVSRLLTAARRRPGLTPPQAIRARRARPADAGEQRGDAGQPGADQPARRPLVPLGRDGVGAGDSARHGIRRGTAPGGPRDRLRHAGAGCARAGGRQRRERRRAGGAGRRLLRQLATGRGRARHAGCPGRAARGRSGVRRGHLPCPASRRVRAGRETARVVRLPPGRAERRAVRPVRRNAARLPSRTRSSRRPSAREAAAAGARTARRCAGCATCSDSSRGAVPATCPTAWHGWPPARCGSSPTTSAATSGDRASPRAGARCSPCRPGRQPEQRWPWPRRHGREQAAAGESHSVRGARRLRRTAARS